MSDAPLVSVIIPTYNRSALLTRAVQSVLGQTYQNWELIIVDDASKDDTEKVVAAFGSPRIRYFKQDVNKGAQAARNTGIRMAKGEYIGFLDSDNEWYPQKLEKQLEVFGAASDKVGVVYSSHDEINTISHTRREMIYRQHGDIYKNLLTYPLIDYITPMVKRECFQKIGLLDEKVPAFHEWDTFIRLSRCYEFGLVPEKLAAYYVHKDSISGSFKRDVKGYFYVMNKHRQEIVKVCGSRVMARHWIRLASRFVVWLKVYAINSNKRK